MDMVSDTLVEEIRERADILEICGESVRLKRTGRTWRGPCPLHGGEGPNFSVDPVRGIFKCFVCGEGGDVFAFVMKHAGLDFPAAIRHVAEKVGIEVPDADSVREDPWIHIREALAFAAEWFAGQLVDEKQGAVGREYLAARGVPREHWTAFGIGLAPDGWRGLLDAARSRGIPDENLLKAGLVATSERAAEPYDRFRDRLMFTIQDLRDRPIAFGGRALGSDEEAPKYINSPESPIFHKRSTLFGLNKSRHAMRREESALIGEGFMDVVSLHVHGFDTAVAPLGTALTTEQAELIGRYTKKVYLLYDSDSAGLRATFRAGDTFLAAGVHPLVVSLPSGEDPDSVLRTSGADALKALMADAVDVLDRKLQILERQGYLESTEGRRRAVDGLLSTLRAVKDPALKDLYLGRAAEFTGVRRETLVSEVTRADEAARTPRTRASVALPGPPISVLPSAEWMLLVLLLRDPSLITAAESEGLTAEHFRHPGLRRIYEVMRATDGDDETVDTELLEKLRGYKDEFVHTGQVFDETVRRLVFRQQLERLGHIDRQLQLADEAQARLLLVEKTEVAGQLRRAGVSLSFLRGYATKEEQVVEIAMDS
ncbi:MAG: DNA primase [Chloroflexi bacterium]|nr:MAG: DNA primase [Chloroflexota bacterium]